jgi:hypothetical protein
MVTGEQVAGSVTIPRKVRDPTSTLCGAVSIHLNNGSGLRVTDRTPVRDNPFFNGSAS